MADDTGTLQNVIASRRSNQCLIQRLRSRRESPNRRQGWQHGIECVHGEDIGVARWRELRRWTGPVVTQIAEVVGDLRTVGAVGNSCVQRQAIGVAGDVVHPPVREGCRHIVGDHDETARLVRGISPGQLGRLVSAAWEKPTLVKNHAQRQRAAVDERRTGHPKRRLILNLRPRGGQPQCKNEKYSGRATQQ